MRTIILPGMGADSSMYPYESYEKLSWVTFAEWPQFKLFQLFTGKISINTMNEILFMFEQVDGNFIKSMCKAIFKWEGIDNYNCEVCQIHGAKISSFFNLKIV